MKKSANISIDFKFIRSLLKMVEIRKLKSIFEEGGIHMTDKTLVCKDCGKEFVFTAGEQEFYKEKGFTNEPTRCKDCRIARKNERFNSRRNNDNDSWK